MKYREGFIKNRYIGRTFIMPGQEERRASVRRKLNAIDLEFGGKNVLLVDDSIVRGTTSQQIIDMAREAGASKVYFASAAPPVRYPNVYGIDMPAAGELIANGRSVKDVQDFIGADWLIYQDLEDLEQAVYHEESHIDYFDTSCFSGKYVTGDVSRAYLSQLEIVRSDSAKAKRDARVRDEESGEDVSAMQAAGRGVARPLRRAPAPTDPQRIAAIGAASRAGSRRSPSAAHCPPRTTRRARCAWPAPRPGRNGVSPAGACDRAAAHARCARAWWPPRSAD